MVQPRWNGTTTRVKGRVEGFRGKKGLNSSYLFSITDNLVSSPNLVTSSRLSSEISGSNLAILIKKDISRLHIPDLFGKGILQIGCNNGEVAVSSHHLLPLR